MNNDAKKVINLTEKKEALDFFKKQKESDKWVRCNVSDLIAVPIPPAPIVASLIKDQLEIKNSTDDIVETIEEIGFLVSYPGEEKRQNGLLRYTATGSAFERGLIKGSIFKKLSAEDTCEILNKCYACEKDSKALILYRDEKISAIHSGDESDYSIIPVFDLLSELTTYLDATYPGYKMLSCSCTYEYVHATFEIPDKSIATELNKVLKKYDHPTIEGNPVITFITSDAGMSAVKLYPSFKDKGGSTVSIGKPLQLTHKNRASIEDFKGKLQQIYATLNEAPTLIEELVKTAIFNPEGCFKKVCKYLKLPKNESLDACDFFICGIENTTALDVYYALYEVLDLSRKNGAGPNRLINIEEAIARSLFIKWDDFDHPFEWM